MKATGRARVCTEVKSVFVLLMALRTFAYLQAPLRYHAGPLAHVHRNSYSWHCLFPGPCYTLDCVKVKYPHFLLAQVSPKPLRQCMQPEKKMIGKCEYFLSFFFFSASLPSPCPESGYSSWEAVRIPNIILQQLTKQSGQMEF